MKRRKPSLQNITKKFSIANIFLIISLNSFITIASLLVSVALYRHLNGELFEMDEFLRVAIPVFCVFIFGMMLINIIYLIKPLLRLQQIIEIFQKTKTTPLEIVEKRDGASALEDAFFEILSEQVMSKEREYRAEILVHKTELMALQSQINPHFLYNALDSIRGFALIHGVDKIAEITEALSRLFRNMIANEGRLISLSEEFESVKNYMLIQQFRFNNKFQHRIEVDFTELLECKVPNLILQPIVENAVIHGLENKEGKGEITIKVSATHERLIITVEDDGTGINEQKLEGLNARLKSCLQTTDIENNELRTGIALININKRIMLQFGEIYGLSIMSTENIGTSVEIVLPIIFE